MCLSLEQASGKNRLLRYEIQPSQHVEADLLPARGPSRQQEQRQQQHAHIAVSLDQSQLDAIRLALTSKITMMQGPTRTGKTFVEVKILEMLFTASNYPADTPALVLTYKNHSLDISSGHASMPSAKRQLSV